MKPFLIFACCCVSALCGMMSSCSSPEGRIATGEPYVLTGTLWQDSLTVDSCVTILIDRHTECLTGEGDTLAAFEAVTVPVVRGAFSYQGKVPYDVDELTLIDQHEHVARFYAASGSRIDIRIVEGGGVEYSASDTLNHWLSVMNSMLGAIDADARKQEVDSVCRLFPADVRSTLMLREAMPMIGDSVFVRRALGRLQEAAKPEWLMEDVNYRFDYLSHSKDKNFRLPKYEVQLPDTTYSLQATRAESLVLLFWAECDSASVDSLRVFRQIARDYGLYDNADTFANEKSPTRSKHARRIELMSVCLGASDSASWLAAVDGIPGKHVWAKDGFANLIAVTCMVGRLPAIYCFDRYSNYQCDDKWGTSMYDYLNRANINSQVKDKPIKAKL